VLSAPEQLAGTLKAAADQQLTARDVLDALRPIEIAYLCELCELLHAIGACGDDDDDELDDIDEEFELEDDD
jgi:hypothetical protein